jgi:hypothetical protein
MNGARTAMDRWGPWFKRHRRTWGAAALMAAGVASGALRDFMHYNLNFQLDHVRRGTPVSYAHSLFQGWFGGLGAEGLVVLKWALAVVFIAVVLWLTLLMDRLLFERPGLRRTVLVGFGAMALTALLLHLGSAWVPALRHVALKMLHALQYPVPLFLVWALARLAPSAMGRRI